MSRLVLLLATAVAAAAARAPRAYADDDVVVTPEHREANALYKEGVRLYKVGEYAGALDLFQRAYERFPAPRVEFSLASTLKQMGRTVEAANWYQRFVDDPGAEPQLVTEARTLLTLLDTTVGRVDVSTDGAPAEVQLGDGAWQAARGHLIARVAAGTLVVRGRRPGFVAEATAQIAAGADQAITLRWTDAAPPAHDHPAPKLSPPAAPPAAPIAPAPPPGRTRRVIALGIAGGGVALAGAALLFQHESRVRVASETAIEQSGGDGTSEYHRAVVDHDLALAGGAAAAIAVGAGAYLWLTAPRDARVQITPLVDDHGVGLLFAGRF